MSKASEYAAALEAAKVKEPNHFLFSDGATSAQVGEDGGLYICGSCRVVKPGDIPDFIDWLRDNFE